jgi:hypothetical protein
MSGLFRSNIDLSFQKSSTKPTTRINGSALQDGDRWFNTFYCNLWNAVLATTQTIFKPSATDVLSFIALSRNCNLPVSFDQSSGEMVISS